MTAKAKKREMVEGIAEKFLLLPESDKSFIAGYLTGKEEERARWQQEQERKQAAETVILFEHLRKALASLKEDTEAAGEAYKYEALEAVYIKGMTYEEIVRETGCGKNSPKKWCKAMIPRLAIKLFGAKALENDTNCTENKNNLNKTG